MPTKKDDVYGDHISHKFNDELMELKTEFLKMGGMVEAQVENAIQALVDGDGHMADEIRANDKKVDKMEVEIDEEATLIIARRQPTARDLRLVISVIKMVADLERVGDEAKKIAKLAIKLQEEGQAPLLRQWRARWQPTGRMQETSGTSHSSTRMLLQARLQDFKGQLTASVASKERYWGGTRGLQKARRGRGEQDTRFLERKGKARA